MARISRYPTSTPAGTDLLIGTKDPNSLETKNFSVQSVVDLAAASPNVVKNNTDNYNTPKVTHIITLTQAEYADIVAAGTPNVNTLFIIV